MDLLRPARQEEGGAGQERSCSYDEHRTGSDETLVAAEVTPLIFIRKTYTKTSKETLHVRHFYITSTDRDVNAASFAEGSFSWIYSRGGLKPTPEAVEATEV